MDMNPIQTWIQQNPMNITFMESELKKVFQNIRTEIVDDLLFIVNFDEQDDRYISILVTNRNGDDILSHNNIKIDLSKDFCFICLKYNDCVKYSTIFNRNNESVKDIPEVWNLNNGDYFVYCDEVLVSKISDDLIQDNSTLELTTDEINSTITTEKKRGRKKKSV